MAISLSKQRSSSIQSPFSQAFQKSSAKAKLQVCFHSFSRLSSQPSQNMAVSSWSCYVCLGLSESWILRCPAMTDSLAYSYKSILPPPLPVFFFTNYLFFEKKFDYLSDQGISGYRYFYFLGFAFQHEDCLPGDYLIRIFQLLILKIIFQSQIQSFKASLAACWILQTRLLVRLRSTPLTFAISDQLKSQANQRDWTATSLSSSRALRRRQIPCAAGLQLLRYKITLLINSYRIVFRLYIPRNPMIERRQPNREALYMQIRMKVAIMLFPQHLSIISSSLSARVWNSPYKITREFIWAARSAPPVMFNYRRSQSIIFFWSSAQLQRTLRQN